MSQTPHDPHQDSDDTTPERHEKRHIPSSDQDVASGQPYDPRQDPETDADLVQEEAPPESGVNRRDPAEGPDDESATDG